MVETSPPEPKQIIFNTEQQQQQQQQLSLFTLSLSLTLNINFINLKAAGDNPNISSTECINFPNFNNLANFNKRTNLNIRINFNARTCDAVCCCVFCVMIQIKRVEKSRKKR